jgi:hypothetical protein
VPDCCTAGPNAAFAERLVASQGVVEMDGANVFTKLGVSISDSDDRRVFAVLRHLES